MCRIILTLDASVSLWRTNIQSIAVLPDDVELDETPAEAMVCLAEGASLSDAYDVIVYQLSRSESSVEFDFNLTLVTVPPCVRVEKDRTVAIRTVRVDETSRLQERRCILKIETAAKDAWVYVFAVPVLNARMIVAVQRKDGGRDDQLSSAALTIAQMQSLEELFPEQDYCWIELQNRIGPSFDSSYQSRVKSQESRVKSQESRVKSQESRIRAVLPPGSVLFPSTSCVPVSGTRRSM